MATNSYDEAQDRRDFVEWLAAENPPRPSVLYYGTNVKSEGYIRQEGFLATQESTDLGPGIYFYDNEDEAYDWATDKGYVYSPVVLAVRPHPATKYSAEVFRMRGRTFYEGWARVMTMWVLNKPVWLPEEIKAVR